ncbi:hypothetical protein Gohar_011684 [Gossypium harknessii]|uniref:Uncharacterized protein n=1 Tax=Gossypium harknessii TaxID=34285 RepID=A0A7J9GUP6_9ROSI|nr:hypothetical protein [Gossypium harknessii]
MDTINLYMCASPAPADSPVGSPESGSTMPTVCSLINVGNGCRRWIKNRTIHRGRRITTTAIIIIKWKHDHRQIDTFMAVLPHGGHITLNLLSYLRNIL